MDITDNKNNKTSIITLHNHGYREEQCAKFNQELFERKYYDWIPYLKAPRKCELNCMPKGERFYYRHAKKVRFSTIEKAMSFFTS